MSSRSGTPIRSVYAHAPFCARRCFYCDFPVTVGSGDELPAWLEAISAELDMVGGEGRFLLAPELATLFVGGGTPSILGPRAMDGLARIIGPHRLAAPDLEWTAEANPESFTETVARGWRKSGVNPPLVFIIP